MYTEEFKKKAAQEATLYGRKFVRVKYGLPETTLRGWIQKLNK